MFSMTPQNIPFNRRSIRTRFAYKFLRALKKLNKRRTTSTSTSTSFNRRCHRVKMAAYASMASAVGSRRAWSRALLWKIRNRSLGRSLAKRNKTAHRALRERISKKGNPSKRFGGEQADELRKLVPGGKLMDLLSLFDETAHYIKCLNSQVQIMRKMVDFYSA